MRQSDIMYLQADALKRTQHHLYSIPVQKAKSGSSNKEISTKRLNRTFQNSMSTNTKNVWAVLDKKRRKKFIVMNDPGLNPKSKRKEKKFDKRHYWNNWQDVWLVLLKSWSIIRFFEDDHCVLWLCNTIL